MLGRLGMTVDECIRTYKKVARAAFTPKRTVASKLPAPPKGIYSAKALEDAIKQTVRECCVEPQCLDQRRQGVSTTESCPHEDAVFRSASCTKTYVFEIKWHIISPWKILTCYTKGCTGHHQRQCRRSPHPFHDLWRGYKLPKLHYMASGTRNIGSDHLFQVHQGRAG